MKWINTYSSIRSFSRPIKHTKISFGWISLIEVGQRNPDANCIEVQVAENDIWEYRANHNGLETRWKSSSGFAQVNKTWAPHSACDQIYSTT